MGGYIAGSDALCDAIRGYGSGFIFTTAMPPALAEGALASIRYLRISAKERTEQQEMAQYLKNKLADSHLPALPSTTHIVPVMVGDATNALRSVGHCWPITGCIFNPLTIRQYRAELSGCELPPPAAH